MKRLSRKKIIALLALQITVSDLSPDIQVKYFDIFSRLHGKEVYKGTGIRLAIEKK